MVCRYGILQDEDDEVPAGPDEADESDVAALSENMQGMRLDIAGGSCAIFR